MLGCTSCAAGRGWPRRPGSWASPKSFVATDFLLTADLRHIICTLRCARLSTTWSRYILGRSVNSELEHGEVAVPGNPAPSVPTLGVVSASASGVNARPGSPAVPCAAVRRARCGCGDGRCRGLRWMRWMRGVHAGFGGCGWRCECRRCGAPLRAGGRDTGGLRRCAAETAGWHSYSRMGAAARGRRAGARHECGRGAGKR